MASKLKNRVVGTTVLVALGVIILPWLLDGQKKHYHDEFAAIPLVPKPSARDELDMLSAATTQQALPAKPPEVVWEGNYAAQSLDLSSLAAGKKQTKLVANQQLVEKPWSVSSTQQTAALVDRIAPTDKAKAYVVQLGALKNYYKVNEIVSKLRGAGYLVYTSPAKPVQGKITRILVGPDASKKKLKGSLGALKQLSGLSGVVIGYN